METSLSARSAEIKEPNVVEILLPWLQKKISQHFFFPSDIFHSAQRAKLGSYEPDCEPRYRIQNHLHDLGKLTPHSSFQRSTPACRLWARIRVWPGFCPRTTPPVFGTGIYRMPAKFTRGHHSLFKGKMIHGWVGERGYWGERKCWAGGGGAMQLWNWLQEKLALRVMGSYALTIGI